MGGGNLGSRRARVVTSLVALCVAGCGMSIPGLGVVAPRDPVVVFASDATVDGHDELYVCNADGASRRKVSGALGIGSGVTWFAWSPDRQRIAFLDDKTFPGQHDLYVVDPLDGSPTLVSGQPTFGKDLTMIRWSPDSSKILVRGSLGVLQDDLLAAIPAAGGPIAVLTPPGIHPTFSDGWWWSPDSTAVAFLGEQTPGGPSEFYIAEADGSASKVVSGSLVPGGSIGVWFTEAWSPDGARVVFRGDRLVDGKTELFTAKRDGTGLTKVSHALADDEDVSVYAWSPASARLAYMASSATSPFESLYAVDGAGGAVVPVSGAAEQVAAFAWRPDGTGIAFSDHSRDGGIRLGDPVVGGSSLLAGFAPGDYIIGWDFAWSPNGARLAYRSGGLGGPPAGEAYRLYSVAPGEDPVLLSTSAAAGDGDVPYYAWKWSPDSQTVAFRAWETQYGPRTVFTSPASGGGEDAVSTPGVDVGDHDLGWSSDGARLVWEEGFGPGLDRLFSLEAGAVDTLAAPAHPFSSISRFSVR